MKTLYVISLMIWAICSNIFLGCRPQQQIPIDPFYSIRVIQVSPTFPTSWGWEEETGSFPPYIDNVVRDPRGIVLVFVLRNDISSISFTKYTYYNKESGREQSVKYSNEDLGIFHPPGFIYVGPWSVPEINGPYELRVYIGEVMVGAVIFNVEIIS